MFRIHESKDLRVTIIKHDGKVIYDNMGKDFRKFSNQAKRAEIAEALLDGMGTSVDDKYSTLKHDYFYVASYFPSSQLVVRTALPYNDDLAKSLEADAAVISWFALLCRHHSYACAITFHHSYGK